VPQPVKYPHRVNFFVIPGFEILQRICLWNDKLIAACRNSSAAPLVSRQESAKLYTLRAGAVPSDIRFGHATDIHFLYYTTTRQCGFSTTYSDDTSVISTTCS
jgi:hypothetical protein